MEQFKKILEIAGLVNLIVALFFWIFASLVHAIIKKLKVFEALKYTIVGMFLGCISYMLLYYQFDASHVLAVAISSAISAHTIKVVEILDKIFDAIGDKSVELLDGIKEFILLKLKIRK